MLSGDLMIDGRRRHGDACGLVWGVIVTLAWFQVVEGIPAFRKASSFAG